MGEELSATWLIDRALQFLLEGSDEEAAEWLKACPLLSAEARPGFGGDVVVELEFGCSRSNMSAFQEEDGTVADQIYSTLAAVSSPNRVRYSISLRYLTEEELNVDRDDIILELTESTHDAPPF